VAAGRRVVRPVARQQALPAGRRPVAGGPVALGPVERLVAGRAARQQGPAAVTSRAAAY